MIVLTRFVACLVLAVVLCIPAFSMTGEVSGLTQAGLIAMDNGKYAVAEQKLLKASKLAKVSGPLYADYAETLLNLGKLYDRKKSTEKSEAKYKEALSIYTKAYGPKALQVAKAYHGLGELYRHQKNYMKSIPYYNKALKIRQVSAPGHTDLASTAYGLARTFLAIKRYEEAQPLLKEVVSIQEKAYGDNDKRMVKTLYELAKSYEGSNKLNLAIPTYERVIKVLKGAYGENNPRIASTYERMGAAYRRTLHYKEAEKAYSKALQIREVHKTKFPDKYADCVHDYVKVLKKLNKNAEAQKWQAKLGGAKKG